VTQQASQSHARQRRSMQRAIKILLASDGGLNNEPTQKHIEEKEPLTCQEGEGEEEYDALLLALPKELLIEIFCFCSIKDVCKAREVSRTWRNLIERDALLWRRLGRRDLALPDIEEFMSPQERASMREGQEPINWVDIYRRAFGGWDDTPQFGTILSESGRTISYLPGDQGYRCFISKKAFNNGTHYIEVHFKTLVDGFYKGVPHSNTYGFGIGNHEIYTINGGSSYLASNNGRGWYDNGNAYNIEGESPTVTFPTWGEKDTLGVSLDFDNNKAAFFKNRERVTKFFNIYSDPDTSSSKSIHVVCLAAKGGEWTIRYCGSKPPTDISVSLVEDN
jgi:hypothetical protein